MSTVWIDIHKNPNVTQKFWFVIRTKTDKLAHSEMYTNKSDCVAAAKLIRASASGALIYDETGAIQSDDVNDKIID